MNVVIYQVHFYPSNGQGNNVFANDRTRWGLSDKPLVIGEFSVDGTSPVAANQSYAYLYEHGYDGAWAWAYTADNAWPSMQTPMRALYGAHSDVGIAHEPARGRDRGLLGNRGYLRRLGCGHVAAPGDRVDRPKGAARSVEQFTGARRHRNIRVGPNGELHYEEPAPPT